MQDEVRWFIVDETKTSEIAFEAWADKLPRFASLHDSTPEPCIVCGTTDGSCTGKHQGGN